MIEIGRVCVKIAGRDAGLKCVVIDILDKTYVTIDGQARRRKANILHLEPTQDKLDISKGASHDEVVKAFKSLKVDIAERKPKKKAPAPKEVRGKKGPKQAAEKAPKKKLDEKVKVAQQPKAAPAKVAPHKPIAVAAH